MAGSSSNTYFYGSRAKANQLNLTRGLMDMSLIAYN